MKPACGAAFASVGELSLVRAETTHAVLRSFVLACPRTIHHQVLVT